MKHAINEATFDRFSLLHLAAGFGLGLFVPIPFVLAIAIGWELFERPAKKHAPEFFPHKSQDSPRNMAGDVLAMTAGAYIAKGV